AVVVRAAGPGGDRNRASGRQASRAAGRAGLARVQPLEVALGVLGTEAVDQAADLGVQALVVDGAGALLGVGVLEVEVAAVVDGDTGVAGLEVVDRLVDVLLGQAEVLRVGGEVTGDLGAGHRPFSCARLGSAS